MDDYTPWIADSCPGTWLQHVVSKVLINRAPLGEASTGSISRDGDARACAHYVYLFSSHLYLWLCAIWCLEKLIGYSTGVLRCSNFLAIPVFFESFVMVDAHGLFFWLQVMNYVCSLFFFVELILRMIAWLGDPHNFIDSVLLAPKSWKYTNAKSWENSHQTLIHFLLRYRIEFFTRPGSRGLEIIRGFTCSCFSRCWLR